MYRVEQQTVYVPARRGRLITLPFRILWRLATWMERVIGIVLLLLLGVSLMVVGVILCGSILGMPLGIPAFIVGLLLTIRGIY